MKKRSNVKDEYLIRKCDFSRDSDPVPVYITQRINGILQMSEGSPVG
jgi:hypothetical protein